MGLTRESKENKLGLSYASKIKSGDELRNLNSFEYLQNIARQIPGEIWKELESEDPQLYSHVSFLVALRNKFYDGTMEKTYDPKERYGNLYTDFLLAFQDNIESFKKLIEQKNKLDQQIANLEKELQAIKNIRGENKPIEASIKEKKARLLRKRMLTLSIYNIMDTVFMNRNKALERAGAIAETVIADNPNTPQTSSKFESLITQHLSKNQQAINRVTPQKEGSALTRLSAQFGGYLPQMFTSLPSVRHYKYMAGYSKKTNQFLPIEIRIGTQGQFFGDVTNAKARVNPLFEFWLSLEEKRQQGNNKPVKITHIYFNNLGWNRSSHEGLREKNMTNALHELEEKHRNIAVITLPADKGIMDRALLKKSTIIPVSEAKDRILTIAVGTSDEKVKDFYISDSVKQQLYGVKGNSYDTDAEKRIMEILFDNSLRKLGFSSRQALTQAEFQAVYFHFIKYEVTNFILEKIKPDSFNISCKDAIDRGGVSSAYYNLIKSIELGGTKMDQLEFHRALHAAPTLVKGRGMNHHTQLIWNAVNSCINGGNINTPPWLKEWRDNNNPHTKQKNVQMRTIADTQTAKKNTGSSPLINDIKDMIENINHWKLGSVFGIRLGMGGKEIHLDDGTVKKVPSSVAKIHAICREYLAGNKKNAKDTQDEILRIINESTQSSSFFRGKETKSFLESLKNLMNNQETYKKNLYSELFAKIEIAIQNLDAISQRTASSDQNFKRYLEDIKQLSSVDAESGINSMAEKINNKHTSDPHLQKLFNMISLASDIVRETKSSPTIQNLTYTKRDQFNEAYRLLDEQISLSNGPHDTISVLSVLSRTGSSNTDLMTATQEIVSSSKKEEKFDELYKAFKDIINHPYWLDKHKNCIPQILILRDALTPAWGDAYEHASSGMKALVKAGMMCRQSIETLHPSYSSKDQSENLNKLLNLINDIHNIMLNRENMLSLTTMSKMGELKMDSKQAELKTLLAILNKPADASTGSVQPDNQLKIK